MTNTTITTEIDRVLGANDEAPEPQTIEAQVEALHGIVDTLERTITMMVEQHGEVVATMTLLAGRIAVLERPRHIRRAAGRR